MKRWVIVFVLAAMACGGENEKPPTIGGRPNPDKDSGTPREQDAGPDAGDVPEVGPVLEITSPLAAVSPSDESVWTESTITVRCKATQRQGGAKVDGSSVKLVMETADPESTERISAPIDANGDIYEAKFDVSGMPNGELRFHCTAKDLAATAATSAIRWTTLLDLGPTIQIAQPASPKYALRLPVPIEFNVSAAPIAAGDDKAAVKAVKLQVSGRTIEVAEAANEPGVYRTTVDFGDRTVFDVAPPSAEILVTASSSRTPIAPVRSVKRDIVIDSQGPVINVEQPTSGSVIHGKRELVVTVMDTGTVQKDSLVAEFPGALPGGAALEIRQWSQTGVTNRALFDTGNFDPTVNQVTIQIYATDDVGNSTRISHTLSVDNVPPILSLDPPDLREWREVSNTVFCSEVFDPLGDDAVDDLSEAVDYAQFRVLVEDKTNSKPGQTTLYHAGVDQTSVTLFAQGDPTVGLLVDTNGDGFCDEINTSEHDSTLGNKTPVALQLKPATPRGSPWYPKTLTTTPSGCMADPNGAVDPPDWLCDGALMARVVPGRASNRPPAVYGLDPLNNSEDECEGKRWLIGNIVGEGWACFAARASDTIGNVGVSAPIRVCFDDINVAGTPACKNGGEPAPSCLKNCQIADGQRYPSGMLWEQQ